ncbi:hypothetical protein B566_EDAN011500 [Ephemera danica]|nr:hypothetical protein B566_EDAN011500 [Ephemera danica]
MVKIVVKKGNDIEFLYETHIDTPMEKIYSEILTIFNARIKITDMNYELGRLALHGPVMPLNMQGLAPGQGEELGLKDEFAEQLGEDWVANPDPLGKRCGRQPPEHLRSVLTITAENAKQAISKVGRHSN